jgi:DNA-binding Lrp family transcriptional regulator
MTVLEKDILNILTEDARIPAEKIAVMLSEDVAKIKACIAEMEKSGLLVKYTAIINSEKTDNALVEALIEVKVTPKKKEGFDGIAKQIASFPEVKAVYLMSGAYDLAVMDIHAEATSEKLALAHYFDGRIHVMFGTHTHVPTADTQILPKGSGYVTDLGMCGPQDGILGTDKDAVIDRFRTMMPTRFSVATGNISANGVIFEANPESARVTQVERINF